MNLRPISKKYTRTVGGIVLSLIVGLIIVPMAMVRFNIQIPIPWKQAPVPEPIPSPTPTPPTPPPTPKPNSGALNVSLIFAISNLYMDSASTILLRVHESNRLWMLNDASSIPKEKTMLQQAIFYIGDARRGYEVLFKSTQGVEFQIVTERIRECGRMSANIEEALSYADQIAASFVQIPRTRIDFGTLQIAVARADSDLIAKYNRAFSECLKNFLALHPNDLKRTHIQRTINEIAQVPIDFTWTSSGLVAVYDTNPAPLVLPDPSAENPASMQLRSDVRTAMHEVANQLRCYLKKKYNSVRGFIIICFFFQRNGTFHNTLYFKELYTIASDGRHNELESDVQKDIQDTTMSFLSVSFDSLRVPTEIVDTIRYRITLY